MKSKNCPNCAAPYDVVLNKCPYCGTSYFDMSCIDITGDEPFYLKLKMNGHIFTSRVFARPDVEINITDDTVYIQNNFGNMLCPISVGGTMDIDLHFMSAPQSSGNIFSVELEENK